MIAALQPCTRIERLQCSMRMPWNVLIFLFLPILLKFVDEVSNCIVPNVNIYRPTYSWHTSCIWKVEPIRRTIEVWIYDIRMQQSEGEIRSKWKYRDETLIFVCVIARLPVDLNGPKRTAHGMWKLLLIKLVWLFEWMWLNIGAYRIRHATRTNGTIFAFLKLLTPTDEHSMAAYITCMIRNGSYAIKFIKLLWLCIGYDPKISKPSEQNMCGKLTRTVHFWSVR